MTVDAKLQGAVAFTLKSTSENLARLREVSKRLKDDELDEIAEKLSGWHDQNRENWDWARDSE